MQTYIALLRGINVGGQKKILMADLKKLLEDLHFKNVQTYIQSGNVIFTTDVMGETAIAHQIQKVIMESYNFEVPVLVLTPENVKAIFEHSIFEGEELTKSYFTLLHTIPTQENKLKLSTYTFPNETFVVTDDCVYLYPEFGAGRAKATNNFFEKKLGVTATTRNYKTMKKLLEMTS